MRPQDTRVWRKAARRTRRGTWGGRRSTHLVETTYGRGQRDAEWRTQWALIRDAARRDEVTP
jgi:hypothetical protein